MNKLLLSSICLSFSTAFPLSADADQMQLDPRTRFMLEYPSGDEAVKIEKEYALFKAEGSYSKVKSIPGARENINVPVRTVQRPKRRTFVAKYDSKPKYWQPPHQFQGPKGDFDQPTSLRHGFN